MLFRVIDIETTGMNPPAEIIEVGRVDAVRDGTSFDISPPKSRLYRPLNGIPPETMAVHHITLDDFDENTPVCTHERLHSAVWSGATPDILVAHNCDFERKFITPAITQGLPWICTFKVALRVWPNAPRHTNQVLRYWREIVLDRELAMPPHRAGPDAWVTAHLLRELADIATVEQMISWTAEPALYPTLLFGRYRGKFWHDVPTDYLEWLVKRDHLDEGVKFSARKELTKRGVS